MSFAQDENPYAPVTSEEAVPAQGQPLQGYSKVACVLFVILGALGLLTTLQSVFGLLYMALGPADAKVAMNPFPGAIAISVFLVIVKFVISVGDIVGGIQGLQQKRFGAKLIRWLCGAMMIVKVIETAFGAAFTYLGMDAIIEQSMKDIAEAPNQPPFDMGQFMHVIFIVTICATIAMGIGMFLFYLFTFLHFSKPKTQAQFYKE
jgi:hypothetical protein